MSIFCLFSSCTAFVLRRLLICSVCCCLGGCAWIDDAVSPRPDLDRVFTDMAKSAKGMRDVAKAATAAVRPIGQLKKSMDSLGELATELGSMPLPGQGVEPRSPGALPDGTTVTCGSTAEGRESAAWGEFTTNGRRTRLFLTYDCRIRHEDGPEAELLEAPDAASFKAVCRDPVSGRDHAVVRTIAGPSPATVQIWGIDPESSALTPFYTESWGELEPGDYDKWGWDRLIAKDGTCLWRKRQEARATP